MKNICAIPFFLLALTGSRELTGRQTMSSPEITVRGPRPLRDALVKIEEQLGRPIHFEEARNQHLSSAVGESALRSEKTLTIRFVDAEQNPLAAVNTVLTAYQTAGLPGEYEAHQEGSGAIAVFPTKAMDPSGRLKEVMPVLLRPVSLPSAYRTTDEAIRAVAGDLSRQIGLKVIVLNQPIRSDEKILLVTNEEPAIVLLERLVNNAEKISFRLLFDSSEKAYYLNVDTLETDNPNLRTSFEPTRINGS